MQKLTACILLLQSLLTYAQKAKQPDELTLTRLKTAEAYYRLDQIGEAKSILNAIPPTMRSFEWQLLNARSDRSIHTISNHTRSVVALAVSKNGKYLASGSADSSIILYDATNYQVIKKIQVHKGQVTSLDFSPDGNTLISGSTDRSLRLWDVSTGTEIRNYNNELKQGIYQCRFSNDGKMLAVASWELVTANNSRYVQGFAKVLDVQSGALIKRFDTDNHPASAVKFSTDDKKLYTGTWGFMLKQHDIATGNTDWNFDMSKYDYYTAIQTLDISPDNKVMVQGGKDNKFRLLSAVDGKLLHETDSWMGHTQWVNATRFSPDGKYFATASDDGLVKIWETTSAKNAFIFKGHTGGIYQLAWHPDGKRLFSSSADKTIKVWSIEKPGEINVKPFVIGLWYAPLSPDGNFLATAGYDKQFALWNVNTGKQHLRLDSNNNTSAVFSSDNKYVAAGHYNIDIYEVESGKKVSTGKGHKGRILGMDYSSSHQLFLTAGDNTVRLWKARDTSAFKTIAANATITTAAFSADGKFIYAAGMDGKIRMINSANWQISDSVQMQSNPINNMAVSPDGRFVATIGEAGEAKVMNVKTKKITALKGHTKPGFAIAFHPSLPLIATGNYDQTVRFWNAETGTNTLTLFGYPEAIYTVSFSRDGKKLVITEVEGRMHFISL